MMILTNALTNNWTEKLVWKIRVDEDCVQISCYKTNTQTLWFRGLLLTVALAVLSACGDGPAAKLDQKIAASNEARRGIYVNLSTDLQTAISIPNSQTNVELRKTSIISGRGDPSTTIQKELTITDSIASYKPPQADARGSKFRYDVQIWHQSAASDVRLLLAVVSKISDKPRVEFASDELNTVPYDLDGNGSLETSEIKYLDFDEDGLHNLAEIVEGGNPQNSAPTFVSPTNITLAENEDSNGYVFYTARAISARSDSSGTRQTITYAVDVNNTDSRIKNLLIIDPTEGTLSIQTGNRLPAYESANGNNEYTITLTATDRQATGEIRVSLNITDIFNLTVTATTKALRFQWAQVVDNSGSPAAYYQLLQDINGDGDYILISQNNAPVKITETQFTHDVALHLNALKPTTRYQLKAYRQPDPALSAILIKTSVPLTLANGLPFPEGIVGMIALIKASNTTGGGDQFGDSVALSADGQTLAVGAPFDDNGSQGVSCDPATPGTCKTDSGAVYVFQKTTATQNFGWQQQARLKASNIETYDRFGWSVVLSADGQTLAVGAPFENDGAQVISCDPAKPDTCKTESGAVYVFQKTTTTQNFGWQQRARLNTSNIGTYDRFGWSVVLSTDGQTLAVGTPYEDDSAQGVSCDPAKPETCKYNSGAVYVFQKTTASQNFGWQQQDRLKASNSEAGDWFGSSIALSADGETLLVGASREDGAQLGVSHLADLDPSTALLGDMANVSPDAGAVYLYRKLNATWQARPLAYLKASNTSAYQFFGYSVALSADGQTLAVGAGASEAVYLY